MPVWCKGAKSPTKLVLYHLAVSSDLNRNSFRFAFCNFGDILQKTKISLRSDFSFAGIRQIQHRMRQKETGKFPVSEPLVKCHGFQQSMAFVVCHDKKTGQNRPVIDDEQIFVVFKRLFQLGNNAQIRTMNMELSKVSMVVPVWIDTSSWSFNKWTILAWCMLFLSFCRHVCEEPIVHWRVCPHENKRPNEKFQSNLVQINTFGRIKFSRSKSVYWLYDGCW